MISFTKQHRVGR